MPTAADLATLIEPHIPALRRYAFALTRNHAAADDLVQDCLERALGRWHLRRQEGDLRAWLFAILHNLFVSGLRRQRRRGEQDRLEDAEPGMPGDQEAPWLRRDILDGLGALSPEQRAVLVLVSVEGMAYQTAGRVLGIPVGTVMSRLARARERLRNALECGAERHTAKVASLELRRKARQ